ncbi:hypothetical protein K7432_013668 [Basidiobolus ranarum]|uniref:Sulfotransferase n=1 Tax=Basidiobolus ranarum TaxID=34480 RepID=A0ABR2VQN5_9FUNG
MKQTSNTRLDLIAKQLASHVSPVLLLWTTAYLLGWWLWLLAFYVVTPYFAPFTVGPYVLTYIRCSLMDTSIPLHVRSLGLCRLFYVFFLRQPLFNIAWWMDEILFPLYHLVLVKSPIFILGQPRSGTTKLLDLLATNEDHVLALKLWEYTYPILWLQYLVDYIGFYDEKYFNNWMKKQLDPFGKDETNQLSTMHRISMEKWEEDDMSFSIHFMFSATDLYYYPSLESMELVTDFSSLDKPLRRRMFDFHQKMVKKVLFRRGNEQSVYMAKWVACWNGEYKHITDTYPDARCVFIYRDPEESIPSLLKLYSGVSLYLTNFDPLPSIEFRRGLMRYVYRGHREEIEFVKSLIQRKQHVQIVAFSELYQNIEEHMEKINGLLRLPMSVEYKQFLREEHKKQAQHTKTDTESHTQCKKEIDLHCPGFCDQLNVLQKLASESNAGINPTVSDLNSL